MKVENLKPIRDSNHKGLIYYFIKKGKLTKYINLYGVCYDEKEFLNIKREKKGRKRVNGK